MIARTIVASALVLSFGAMAFAQSGTPEQRAACRPDVRRFCHKLREADGDDAYLQCLELNRDRLSKACGDMLSSYGK
jgi:hypothetical protein